MAACVTTGWDLYSTAGRRFLAAKLGIAGAFVLFSTACNVTRHLDESKGEQLVVKNKLELEFPGKVPISEKTALQYELNDLYKIKTNSVTLGLFRMRLSLYYKHKDKDKRFSRWIIKRFAEPPALYNQTLTEKTISNFVNYMHNRGYFDATCTYKNDTLEHHKVTTTYRLHAGERYVIDSVSWISKDSAALDLLTAGKSASLLKRGSPLDGQLFEREKIRITETLKNAGYAYFAPNFVEFLGDTVGSHTNVTIDVLTPTDSTVHHHYTFGSIQVYTSLVPDVYAIQRDTAIEGVYYAYADKKFRIRPDKLHREIAIKPGTTYCQADIDRTAKNLNALGTYRFVSVRPYQDSVDESQQDIVISLTPNKRLSLGWNLELNTSYSSASSQLLGFSGGLNFRNSNVFGGAESWTSDLSYGLEFDLSNPEQFIFSQEISFNNQLTFPRFFDYLGWWKNLHAFHIGSWKPFSDEKYRRIKNEATTRLNLNYSYLELIDFYNYNLINARFGYNLSASPGKQVSIDLAGLDVLQPTLEPRFDSLYGDNDFYELSFQEQLFTGIFFRDFNMNIYTNPNKFGEHNFFRFSAELSGLEVEAANELWGLAFQHEEWGIGPLEFASFFRLNLDGGYIREYHNGLTLATRVGAGIVRPFGGTPVTPYVKQFFIGGPSSLRAFRLREIGPGGFQDPLAPTDPPFYQSADFRFEFNAELRFPLFLALKGAVFLDGGNVWAVSRDDPRPFSHLEWDAYRQIALGTGFGTRIDVEYFVIRFDFGLPLRKPRDNGGYWIPYFTKEKLTFNDFTLNVSVGYPF